MREDPFYAQHELFKSVRSPDIILDVGAFNGSISLKYHRMFPKAKIFSIEPFPVSFKDLKEKTVHVDQINPKNIAFSDKSGTERFSSNSYSQTNSLLPTQQEAFEVWTGDSLQTREEIVVETITLDEFSEIEKIGRIDILKLDVQGAEVKVLNGAKEALKNNRIKSIYTEIITLPTYVGQARLSELLSFLEKNGFELFNIYNHSYTDQGKLRQVDALFVLKGHF